MTLDMACEGCGQKYRLPAALAGKLARCKACGHEMRIPAAPPEPAPPPPAPAQARPARPPLQTFNSAAPTKARPPLQSFGAAPSQPPPRRPEPPRSREAPPPVVDFEEVDDDDSAADPYGLDEAMPMPAARPRRVDEDEEDAVPAMKRSGKPTGEKKKKGKRLTDTAGFGKRFAAAFVDGFVMIPISLVCLVPVITSAPAMVPGQVDPQVLAAYQAKVAGTQMMIAILTGLYYVVMEASPIGASLGKLALGLRVVDTQGMHSPGRAVVRGVLRTVSNVLVLPWLISAVTVMATQRNQALHDMLSGSMVVNKN